jgi:large subunit ribosomal protein L10
VNFKGLSVANATDMRRELKKENVTYSVAKKTLTRRAMEGQDITGEAPELTGELALAWGDDLVAPARGVHSFQKKFPDNLKILGGIFEGRFMTAPEMVEIASIPPLDVLRGKFVNIINSPIQRFAIALGQVSTKK